MKTYLDYYCMPKVRRKLRVYFNLYNFYLNMIQMISVKYSNKSMIC